MSEPLVEIRRLEVTFSARERKVRALRGLDLEIRRGVIHALVGESGSGKSVTARSLLGLLPTGRAIVTAESLCFDGKELLGLEESRLEAIRGESISMIFQEPTKHLNPSLRIGTQISGMIRAHRQTTKEQSIARAAELIELVGLGDGPAETRRILRSFPHELSGGMNQRAMIALALSCFPQLLIADEPTTSLDVTIQRQILGLLSRLSRNLGMAVLFISHDLGVVHELAEEVSVIYAGRIVENGPADELFDHPLHPYTKLLLASIPDASRRGGRLASIPGTVPDAEAVPPGCAFHPRCPAAEEICRSVDPVMHAYGPEHRAACHFVGKPVASAPGEPDG